VRIHKTSNGILVFKKKLVLLSPCLARTKYRPNNRGKGENAYSRSLASDNDEDYTCLIWSKAAIKRNTP
jgi:hypothetical protein